MHDFSGATESVSLITFWFKFVKEYLSSIFNVHSGG